MELALGGRTAIVTGGASNIGKAICEGLAREGANVVVADVDEAQARHTVEGLEALGVGALFARTDVGDREQVVAMVAAARERFGPIDILVNNAGWTANDLFVNKSYDDFRKEVDINFWGPIHCIKALAPAMIERGYGKIITIGSDAGRVGEYNEAVYGACKGGMITLTKALAREFGKHGINVNIVCPGLTLPENPDDAGPGSLWHEGSHQSRIFKDPEVLKKVVRHYPLRRIGTPADIVPTVLLLASDAASYITGQCISVSGGYAM